MAPSALLVCRVDSTVPGQRGLNGDLGGFAIADFAHQHYVRITAQDGAQAAGESHLDFGVDWVWPMPSSSYSTGSSMVMMLRSRASRRLRAA